MTLADQAAITGHPGQVTSSKPERPKRRTFTAANKARILAEFDAPPEGSPERGALVCRERLYHSHIEHWRSQQEKGTPARPPARHTPSGSAAAAPNPGHYQPRCGSTSHPQPSKPAHHHTKQPDVLNSLTGSAASANARTCRGSRFKSGGWSHCPIRHYVPDRADSVPMAVDTDIAEVPTLMCVGPSRSFAVEAYIGRKAAGWPFAHLDIGPARLQVRLPFPWFTSRSAARQTITAVSVGRSLARYCLRIQDTAGILTNVHVHLPVRPDRVIQELHHSGYVVTDRKSGAILARLPRPKLWRTSVR